MDLKKELDDITIAIDSIADPVAKIIIARLLNIIEEQAKIIMELKTENQKLRDENNRLKGEQGKPNIRPQSGNSKNISSETERKRKTNNKKKKSKKKKHKIKVNRIVKCEVDKSQLPSDATFKGYQSVIVQDITLITNNIKFRKEVYYSSSLKKTFIAPLPKGYEGEFGPGIKTFVLSLYHQSKMTEPAIVELLNTHGIFISGATVSRMLTNNHEDFHQEKKDVVAAGLPTSTYQQMDDTGARVNGQNYYTHILCNPLYTAYFTRLNKDRLTILEILNQQELKFHFNEASYSLMEQMQLPKKTLNKLQNYSPKEEMVKQEVECLLDELFLGPKQYLTNRRIILEASAITAYQQSSHAIKILLTDDAPQFKQITRLLALCWVHDGRHYKKLNPIFSLHKKQLEDFLDSYWVYYHKLLDYKSSPTPEFAQTLSEEFDTIFSTQTGYAHLDERIEKTKMKKEALLLVLQHPELPLHNNAAELGARVQARKRDISLQTKSIQGTEAKDTFMTIVETAKKLGVNVYHYIHDRVSQKLEMVSLADLILQRSTINSC